MSVIVLLERASYTKEQQHCARLEEKGECVIDLEYARTAEEQVQGLSDRNSMPAGHGLLFVFLKPDTQCFWMKDMQFPLDIIWLDANKKVVYLEQNLTPATYPNTYCSASDTQYVLEINAGEAQKLGMQVGQQLYF